jgi:lipopolysaccharide transport system ATP-binding protein
VDEVLAVGDAEFQKKCLGKMHDVATTGRTVLFVSHNMQAVSLLCTRGLFLSGGSLAYAGSVKETIELYLTTFSGSSAHEEFPERRPGSGEYRYTFASPAREWFGAAEEKAINFEITRRNKLASRMWLSALIVDSGGVALVQFDSRLVGTWIKDSGRFAGQLRFTTPWLKPGSYRVDLVICGGQIIDLWEGACSLTISPILPYPNSASQDGTAYGLVFGDFSWEADELIENCEGEPQKNVAEFFGSSVESRLVPTGDGNSCALGHK